MNGNLSGTHGLRPSLQPRMIYAALDHVLLRTSNARRHVSVSTTVQYLFFREEDIDATILRD